MFKTEEPASTARPEPRAPALPPPRLGEGYHPHPPLRLRACLPRLEGLALSQLKHVVEGARRRFDPLSQKEGRLVPVAIVLSENAMDYRFVNLTFERALGDAQALAACLPAHFVFAFAAKLEYKKWAANVGFLVSPQGVQPAFKRHSTEYDARALQVYELDRHIEEENWNARGDDLMRRHIAYPVLELPTGLALEYRVCLDVRHPPMGNEPERTVTLVSASLLRPDALDSLSRRRRAILVNDGGSLLWARVHYPLPPPNVWKSNQEPAGRYSMPLLQQAGIQIHTNLSPEPMPAGSRQYI